VKLSSEVEIDRNAPEVFAVVSDFSRNPEWQNGVVSAAWTSEPPIRVGSTYDQVARFLGKDVVTRFVVTDYQPDHSISIKSVESSFPIEVTRRVDPLGDHRCRVIADIAGDPSGFYRIFGPLLQWMAQRQVRGDYKRLKDLLEH